MKINYRKITKAPKYKNQRIYTCPICWQPISKTTLSGNWVCRHYTTVKPLCFDSQAEWCTGITLKREQKEGKITDLKFHPKFKLIHGLTYTADFQFTKDGITTVVDVKGFDKTKNKPFIQSPTHFKAKLRLMYRVHDIEVEIWAGNHGWVIDQRESGKGKLIQIF